MSVSWCSNCFFRGTATDVRNKLSVHFLIAYHPTGWMQLNKHYMVCVFKVIMDWQVQTHSDSSAAALSFSSFVVLVL